MLNKRIVSAVAAVAVALGGVGAPVFGGIAQNFDISASAYAYDYATFRANCIERGATNRMIEELDKFFLENLDYFTPRAYADFIKVTDKLYEQVMLPAATEKYGKDPSELTNAERVDLVGSMSTNYMNNAYKLIHDVAYKYGVDVQPGTDEKGRLIPVCTIFGEKTDKNIIKVAVKDTDNEVDVTKAEVSIVGADGELLYTQNPDADGNVDVTGLVSDGKTIFVAAEGYAPREIVFDSTVAETDATIVRYGDLDGDGDIDINDFILMQKLEAGWNVSANIIYPEVANVDGKGGTDIKDLVLLQKYVGGWAVELAGYKKV